VDLSRSDKLRSSKQPKYSVRKKQYLSDSSLTTKTFLRKDFSIGGKMFLMYNMYVSRHKNKFIKSAKVGPARRPTVIDFQDEIVEMYVRRKGVEDGVERARGRRFIRWSFAQRLGANQTTQIIAKLRQNINSAFYIRYNYAYVLVNNKNGLRMVFFKQQKGSPWINNFGEAER